MGALPRPELPAGPTRALFDALHELHHRAGWPSLRDMARDVGCSHTTISSVFAGPRPARWGLLELVVESLGGDVAHFHRLWLAASGTAPEPVAAPSLPRQLPADVAGFTGRGDQLGHLDALLDDGASRLVVVSGTPGVGKTALAVHWAHRIAGQFPDGQLYVNLRGYDPDSPVLPEDVLESFLRVLGVDGAAIPASAAERATQWRSAVAGRRMLAVLDNANSAEQVYDLLPGDPSAFVLVTSRDALPGLVARHGAQRVALDLFGEPDALDLLHTLVGPRVALQESAARALAARTARLPLALRIVAELALSRPGDSLDDLVADFDDETEQLDVLSAGEDRYTAVRAVFSWSHRQLAAPERRAFALLGLTPGADIDEQAAAALFGTDVRTARRSLATLARAHLVDDRRRGRIAMHDLLRAYSRELAAALDADEQRAAVDRLYDHYLTSASAVDRTAVGHAWLDAERANLLAVAAAAAPHWPAHTVGLAVALARYLDTCAYYSDALALDELALAAARRSADAAGEATALNLLGSVFHRLGRYAEAVDRHEEARAIHRELGDRVGEAAALRGLGVLAERTGRYPEALSHLVRARDLYLEAGDESGAGQVLYSLGITELRLSRYDDAAASLRRAIEINARIGERAAEGRALNNLGEVHLRIGRLDDAASAYSAALVIARELGNRVGEGVALINLGSVSHRRGLLPEAVDQFTASLAACRDVGYRPGEAAALVGLGAALRDAGEVAEAIEVIEEAIEISRSGVDSDTALLALVELGASRWAAGTVSLAVAAYRAALDAAVDAGDRYHEACARRGLGEVLDDAAETARADAIFADLGLVASAR